MDSKVQRLYDATAAIEETVWLGGLLAQDGEDSRLFRRFIEDLDEDDQAGLFPEVPAQVLGYIRDQDYEGVADWLLRSGTTGIVLKVITPKMEIIDGDQRNFSWGYCTYGYVYGSNLEEAVDRALHWVEGQRTKELAESKKAKGAPRG